MDAGALCLSFVRVCFADLITTRMNHVATRTGTRTSLESRKIRVNHVVDLYLSFSHSHKRQMRFSTRYLGARHPVPLFSLIAATTGSV